MPVLPPSDHAVLRAFAQSIRDLREAAGRPPIRHLANVTGYSESTVRDVLKGRLQQSRRVVQAVAAALGADPEEWGRRWDALNLSLHPGLVLRRPRSAFCEIAGCPNKSRARWCTRTGCTGSSMAIRPRAGSRPSPTRRSARLGDAIGPTERATSASCTTTVTSLRNRGDVLLHPTSRVSYSNSRLQGASTSTRTSYWPSTRTGGSAPSRSTRES
jgi:lambda repressor-like predicted transcriptional regulator